MSKPDLRDGEADGFDLTPWPDVLECYGHEGRQSCKQCSGMHTHLWVAWRSVPASHPLANGPGLPARCRVCGSRKCDMSVCWERRHHQGPHTNIDGAVVAAIGGPQFMR